MADATKSALFVDYDSVHRSLRGARRDAAAARLAERSSAWIAAIEAGKLFAAGDDRPCRILVRRCYADPRLLGSDRDAMIAAGFEVVDCPPIEGRQKNAAPIGMVIDAMDALDHPADYDELILLSPDTDLSPLLHRLRAHNRATVVYANATTPASYRTIADGTIEESALVAVLTTPDMAVAGALARSAEAQRGGSGLDRGEIEALARKVHQATNVPLLSPRTFADLFRVLADEIAEEGYHFQNTAENVTARLVATGRNVNRRQVLFVVKGLALKGHVFSTTDSPERLAEVFREQVLYLIQNAGIELDEREQDMIPSWIVGRIAVPHVPAEADATAEKAAAEDEAIKAPRKRAAKVTVTLGETAAPAPMAPAEADTPEAPRPSGPDLVLPEELSAAPSRRQSTPPSRATTKPADEATDLPARSGARVPVAAPKPAAKPSSDRTAPVARPTAATRPATPPKTTQTRPAAGRPAGSPSPDANQVALESSILAAIAQAVDVLVDDVPPSPVEPAPEPPPAAEEVRPVVTAAEEDPEPPPEEAEASEDEGSGDIGDEIQRIIASYSRARNRSGTG